MAPSQPSPHAAALKAMLDQFVRAPGPQIRKRAMRIGWVVLCLSLLWVVAAGITFAWAHLARHDHPSSWYNGLSDQKRGLVVVVHGWIDGPESMKEVAATVAALPEYKGFGIDLWGYDSEQFSNADPLALADQLNAHIESIGGNTAPEVVLIGHSIGGLIVRRAYLNAVTGKKPWASAVSRIVLLASPNRGSQATSRSSLLWAGDAFARSVGLGKLIRSIYRGAPFIVNLRIDWIRNFPKIPNPPLVAQLIGGNDVEVSQEDSNDIRQFPTARQKVLSQSTHKSILRSAESGLYLREMLLAPRQNPEQVTSQPSGAVFKVLLAHGIRDYGERFADIAEDLRALAGRRQLTVLAVAPRYKYFSALEFINPFSRQLKIYEFADMYAELLATAPVDAPINFVGHSFGTFLMGKSTEIYDSIRFDRVFLAGSVLKEDFFSKPELLGNRIRFLRNDIATKDWPVGILCSALDGLHLAKDVGVGGFDGFTGIAQPSLFEEVRYFEGDHGAALKPANRPTIAEFIFQSAGPSTYSDAATKEVLHKADALVPERSFAWGFASRAAPGLFVVFFAFIGYMIVCCRRPFLVVAEFLVVAWLLNVI